MPASLQMINQKSASCLLLSSMATSNTQLGSLDVDKSTNDAEKRTCDVENGLSTPHRLEIQNEYEDNSKVPKLSFPHIFWLFFTKFGLFAWGGPVAQIALIKDRLVVKDQWITMARFNRVFAVYQILPGPEAAELCMFFGCLSGGRWGGLAAGLGFMLPGFVLMLAASYLYVVVGFGNRYVDASFRALQPMVAAMILRATHKIAEHALVSHETKKANPLLFIYAILTALNSALRINWFISLGIYGLINMLLIRKYWPVASILFILQYVGYALYVVFKGVPSPLSLALGITRTPDLSHLFALGLVAGSLSFGGAYTAIPFIQAEAVLLGRWLPQQVFLDCIALSNILPAPLVIFATFVGFQGGYVQNGLGYAFAGATVITLGMWFPCFAFTIIGHQILEKLVRNKFLAGFFDGICGSIVGVIAIVATQILGWSVGNTGRIKPQTVDDVLVIASHDSIAAVLFLIALAILYRFTNKYTAILLMLGGALVGQFLFV
ncbi:chromate transporter-domain-containing protein [Flagelloscypha sp. PMI_526]|nr:chromate transporter-domain-containing protein [Flagelloscypha sp. PMI_526]